MWSNNLTNISPHVGHVEHKNTALVWFLLRLEPRVWRSNMRHLRLESFFRLPVCVVYATEHDHLQVLVVYSYRCCSKAGNRLSLVPRRFAKHQSHSRSQPYPSFFAGNETHKKKQLTSLLHTASSPRQCERSDRQLADGLSQKECSIAIE